MVLKPHEITHLSLMQSLEQKPSVEPVIDLTPPPHTASLDENILSLTASLRANGLTKYADNLESHFATFKQADVHLYRVHDEDGEDLVEFAHPEGDHHVEDAELGDVETIVSKHNKIKDIVEKSPTGKLASYVEACKVILGQDTNQVKQLVLRASEFVDKAVFDAMKSDLSDRMKQWLREQAEVIRTLAQQDPTDDSMQQIIDTISKIRSDIQPTPLPGFLFHELTLDKKYTRITNKGIWTRVNGSLTSAEKTVSEAQAQFGKVQDKDFPNSEETPSEQTAPQAEGASWEAPSTKTGQPASFTRGPASDKTQHAIQTLEQWKMQLAKYEDPEDVKAGGMWINGTIAKLKAQPDPATLNTILKEVAQFKQTWKMQ